MDGEATVVECDGFINGVSYVAFTVCVDDGPVGVVVVDVCPRCVAGEGLGGVVGEDGE